MDMPLGAEQRRGWEGVRICRLLKTTQLESPAMSVLQTSHVFTVHFSLNTKQILIYCVSAAGQPGTMWSRCS